jgi:hypothetical protein
MSELSARLQKWLEHVRCASEAGVSLNAYANEHGLSASALYQAKSTLMGLGAWPKSAERVVRRAVKPKSVPIGFVPVQVAPMASCRLSHVSGWSIECDLPSAQWLNALVRDVVHAS